MALTRPARPARTATLFAALVLSVAACSGTEQDPSAGSDAGGADPATEAPQGPSDQGAAQPGHRTGTLTITQDGEKSEFTPEVVRCEGESGTIRHVTLAMEGDELPLVEVTPGEFAMVKLEREGAPEKSTSTDGITAEDGSVAFDVAEIGEVVVHGTVNCPGDAQD